MAEFKSRWQKVLLKPSRLGLLVFLIVAGGISKPGITIDEPLDVAPGRHYWATLANRGFDFFSASGVNEAFGGNPDHPPLARWCLGACSWLFQIFQTMLSGHGDPTGLYIVSARMASAIAFGLTVSLVASWSTRTFGVLAGWCAGFALICMPRVFGHAHLAAIETVLNLFTTAAVLAWVDVLADDKKNRPAEFIRPSLALGLALLCKIQAWLLGFWLLMLLIWWRPMPRKFLLSLIAGSSSIVLWFVVWPWLWYQSADRIREYFFRSVDRISLRVKYFGVVVDDRALPWHYLPLQVATALPLGILLLVILGLIRIGSSHSDFRGIDRKYQGIGLCVVVLLVIFSMPVTRYDGDRLVLIIYPLLAIMAGAGALRLYNWLCMKTDARISGVVLATIYLVSVLPLAKPFPLSYFNLLIGGTKGAASLGLETTYWADSIDSTMLNELVAQVKPGERVVLLPTLHGSQAAMTTPQEMLGKGQILQDQAAWRNADYLLVYRREAYWPDGIAEWLQTHEPLILRSRDHVWLAGLWRGPAQKNK